MSKKMGLEGVGKEGKEMYVVHVHRFGFFILCWFTCFLVSLKPWIKEM